MSIIEGKERKGGRNPRPLHPKPKITPPAQGWRSIEIFKIMGIPEAALKRIVTSTEKAAQAMADIGMTINQPPTYCHKCKRYHPAGQKECRLPERKPNVDTGGNRTNRCRRPSAVKSEK